VAWPIVGATGLRSTADLWHPALRRDDRGNVTTIARTTPARRKFTPSLDLALRFNLYTAGVKNKLKVLFLCTGNSCRSQMAEGWARQLKSDEIEPYSAGTEPHGLNPLAVAVMKEAGVDISKQASKHIDTGAAIPFDYVVTVCDSANEACPVFPGRVKRLHVGFDDPPRLASIAASEDEALGHYRRVRDEIRAFVERMPAALKPEDSLV
jgi:arsenate reductase